MSDPIVFDIATSRFALPLLFAGQAQKEVFVNEALVRIDSLLHCAVEAEQSVPPASPGDGQCWLIGTNPSGAWVGQAGNLACREQGQWLYVAARDGMRALNRSTGQELKRIGGGWRAPAAPAAPTGGATIDAEARSAITNLLQRLHDAGIFA